MLFHHSCENLVKISVIGYLIVCDYNELYSPTEPKFKLISNLCTILIRFFVIFSCLLLHQFTNKLQFSIRNHASNIFFYYKMCLQIRKKNFLFIFRIDTYAGRI